MRRFVLLSIACLATMPLAGCKARQTGQGETGGAERGAGPVASTAPPVPPVAAEGTPGAATLDASGPEGEPYAQALTYEAGGQVWLARLVLEKQALAATGAPREAELLARLCAEQGDGDCVRKCEAKLGRKLALDAGLHRGAPAPSARAAEDTSDAARAQRALVKGDAEGARKLLQPKLVAKTISEPELAVLRAACERQRDTMCVLACDGAAKR